MEGNKLPIEDVEVALEAVFRGIAQVLEEARATAYRAVNSAMVQAYWNIGRIIVEEEQQGKVRAEYGAALIPALAKRLTAQFGKGFTENNLWYMRQFHMTFPILHAMRGELSWTHYRLLLKVEKETARQFYLEEAIASKWSTRELERQISSLFYERLLLSRDRKGALQLASEGQMLRTPQDLIKDPYVLKFLEARENPFAQEKDLEQGLMNRLQEFLLELGKGFAFVARQKRITTDGDHFYIDLVFYKYILKCFVLETRLPDEEARGEILRQLIVNLPPAFDGIEAEKLAEVSEGLTGADMKRLIEDGKILFAYDRSRNAAMRPTTDYFIQAIETVRANKERYAKAEAAATAAQAANPNPFAAFAGMFSNHEELEVNE